MSPIDNFEMEVAGIYGIYNFTGTDYEGTITARDQRTAAGGRVARR